MKKILVIEDEDSVREALLELLEAAEFDAIGAENGCIGVKTVQKETPDLIICDIMMPELDGYGVLSTLRRDPTTATIPLIFLSAHADRAEQSRGIALGADDYLTKPCTIATLLSAISTQLDKVAAANT